jgi:hypothetical protein
LQFQRQNANTSAQGIEKGLAVFSISVTSDVQSTIRQLNVRRDQQPFATALALTRTAQDAQAEIRRQLPSRFTIRTPWVAKGVRYKPANKQNLTAVVYDVDPFMRIQETGGEKVSIRKRVFDYGDYLAIPIDARRTKRDVVRREDWPQNLIKPFVIHARDGRTYLAVHALAKKVRAKLTRGGFTIGKQVGGTRIMYILVRRETLRARFGFAATVRDVVDKRFNLNFRDAINVANATARSR